ncbi:MAG: lipoyl(octanoyl) transferase LipB, partial [Gammaproteobacteria bacterium]
MSLQEGIIIHRLGMCDYATTYAAMAHFTRERDMHTGDEIWCLQHPPVFTLGLAGREEHVLNAGDIPVVRTDRGGQVTYHGPGQLIVYLMLDLARRSLTVKHYVYLLEQALIDMCDTFKIEASRRNGAPGVYVAGKKIAALGIRVKRGCSYHGLALNVDMDIAPFQNIHPCGYPGLEITQLKDQGCGLAVDQVFDMLLPYLMELPGLDVKNPGSGKSRP